MRLWGRRVMSQLRGRARQLVSLLLFATFICVVSICAVFVLLGMFVNRLGQPPSLFRFFKLF